VAAGDAALRLFVVREAIAQYEHARDVLVEQEQNHPVMEVILPLLSFHYIDPFPLDLAY